MRIGQNLSKKAAPILSSRVVRTSITTLKKYGIMRPMGEIGAGLCVCDPAELPAGMVGVSGFDDITDDENYGNYQYSDGSIMCCLGKTYYRINNAENDTYGTYAPNDFKLVGSDTFASEGAANIVGYALHRAFKDGGEEKSCVFVDKYMCSKNAKGTGYVASSIKNGLPISTYSGHNPISELTACSGNYYYEAVNAAHARDGVDGAINSDSIFFCKTRFIQSLIAMQSMAHGQACDSAANCAWFDATYNFPKGCNNNALRDTNDSEVLYVSDGYSNCGKTGSGTPFAKTTHNGQSCGIADVNGLMWEIDLGMTRDSGNTAFYALKESIEARTLTAGTGGASTDAWGDSTHLSTLYDVLSLPYVTGNDGWAYIGSSNQVMSGATSGDGYALASLGLPESAVGIGGTDLFGRDGVYRYLRAYLCVRSCGDWSYSTYAGVWACVLSYARASSSSYVGFRCACYPDAAA